MGLLRARRAAGGTLPSPGILLSLLFLVSLVNFLDRHMLSILLPAIKRDLQLTDTQLGLMAGAAFSVVYALMGIPFGRLADRRSPRKVIAGALAFWSAMTAACALAQGFGQLLAARVLVGVGEAGATPAANALIASFIAPERRARALSIFALGLPAGLFVGFLGGGAVAQALGWRVALLAFGLPGLLLAGLVLAALPEPPSTVTETRASLGRVLAGLASRPSFRHLCFGSALFTLGWQGMIAWLPSYFTRSYNLPLAEVGAKLALVLAASQAFGLLAGGAFGDLLARRGLRWPLRMCAAASLLPLALYPAIFTGVAGANGALAILLPAFAIGLVQSAPVLAAVHAVSAPNTRGVAVATYLLVVNVVAGFGALLIGAVSDRLSGTLGTGALGVAVLAVALPSGAWSALHFWLASQSVERDSTASLDDCDDGVGPVAGKRLSARSAG